jgi:hypothetical protein
VGRKKLTEPKKKCAEKFKLEKKNFAPQKNRFLIIKNEVRKFCPNSKFPYKSRAGFMSVDCKIVRRKSDANMYVFIKQNTL